MKIRKLWTRIRNYLLRGRQSSFCWTSTPVERTFECWFIFSDSKNWHRLFCKKGFSHVAVLLRDEFNWVYYDPTFPISTLHVLPYEAKNMAALELFKNNTVVYCKQEQYFKSKFIGPRLGFVSCISMARSITGVKARGFTPYKFYRNILANFNSQVIYGRLPEDSGS